MSRLTETFRPQKGTGTAIDVDIPEIFTGDQFIGRMFYHATYEAMLNRGVKARIVLRDPHFTIMNDYMQQYFIKAQTVRQPIDCKLRLKWMPPKERLLWTNEVHLAVSSIDMINDTDADGYASPDTYIAIEAIDFPRYVLTGGDTGGYCYDGNISQVIRDVVGRYGGGVVDADVKVETKDNRYNKWWQYRLPPLDFICSLLAWSIPTNSMNAKWIIYPKDKTLVISDQKTEQQLHRSMYFWGGHNEIAGHGDITYYKVIYDGSIYQRNAAAVTNGISAVSGAYYDRITDEKDKEVVYARDEDVDKLKPKTKPINSLTKGPTDDPLKALIGWSDVASVPEFSAGDLGILYRDYMKGYAQHCWSMANERMTIIELGVCGHHIWIEPEGLGVDTINIVMQTALRTPHYLNGVWIVYGFRHDINQGGWNTTLWCYRLQHDCEGVAVGQETK